MCQKTRASWLRKFFWIVLFLPLTVCFFSPKTVRAETCSNFQITSNTTNATINNNVITSETAYPSLDIKFDISGQLPADKFIICTDNCGGLGTHDFIERDKTPTDGAINITIGGFLTANSYGRHILHVRNQTRAPSVNVCDISYEIKQPPLGTDCKISAESEIIGNKQFTPNTIITIKGEFINSKCPSCGYPLKITGKVSATYTVKADTKNHFSQKTTRFSNGTYSVELQFGSTCNTSFTIAEDGGASQPSTSPQVKIDPTCDIVHGSAKRDGINTALGCVPVDDLNDFVGWLLRNVIFIASGIAFLLMAFGALQIITSAGNPEKMKAGSEMITSALSGLLLIIFSVFLLKLIGVDILQIPGFGT